MPKELTVFLIDLTERAHERVNRCFWISKGRVDGLDSIQREKVLTALEKLGQSRSSLEEALYHLYRKP